VKNGESSFRHPQVVQLDDVRARLLAQTLNRTRGTDDPEAYARLLEQVLAEFDVSEVTGLLPESEATIAHVLREFGGGDTVEEQLPVQAAGVPRSRPGEIYEVEAALNEGAQPNAATKEQRAAVASFGGHACPRSDARLLLGSVLRRR